MKADGVPSFDKEYVTRLASGFGPAVELFVVTLGGVVIAGGLFTICDGIVQYHLGATGDAFLKVRPMSLLFDTVRLWANEQGARVVHLGGGGVHRRLVVSPHDRVLRPAAQMSDLAMGRRAGHVPGSVRPQREAQRRAWRAVDLGRLFPQYRRSTLPAETRDGIVVIGAGGHAKVLISTLTRARVFDRGDTRRRRPQVGDGCLRHARESDRTGARRPGRHWHRRQCATPGHGERLALGMADRCPSVRLRLPFGKARARHVVFAGAVVQPDAVIGDHVIVKRVTDPPRLHHRRLRASRARCAPLGLGARR